MNKAWCEIAGDMSQRKWEDAAISQVSAVITGEGETAKESHTSWMNKKLKYFKDTGYFN